MPYAMDFFGDASFAEIATPSWSLQKWSGGHFQMIWGVPILPRSATLAEGATGAYDSWFHRLARTLVAHGQGSCTLAIGPDPNIASTPWAVRTKSQAAQYVEYWRQIVRTMRSVPGARFRFTWDLSGGSGLLPPSAMYPGDAFVNVVATEVFDRPRTVARNWASIASEKDGLNWFASFASSHHKRLAIEEWGLAPRPAGRGDDPRFVVEFLNWVRLHDVAYAITWDYGTWSLAGGSFPRSTTAVKTVVADGNRVSKRA